MQEACETGAAAGQQASMAIQLYEKPDLASRELAIREPDNEEARAARLAEVFLSCLFLLAGLSAAVQGCSVRSPYTAPLAGHATLQHLFVPWQHVKCLMTHAQDDAAGREAGGEAQVHHGECAAPSAEHHGQQCRRWQRRIPHVQTGMAGVEAVSEAAKTGSGGGSSPHYCQLHTFQARRREQVRLERIEEQDKRHAELEAAQVTQLAATKHHLEGCVQDLSLNCCAGGIVISDD